MLSWRPLRAAEGLPARDHHGQICGWESPAAVWGQISVCHGNQLGPLVMLSLRVDKRRNWHWHSVIPKLDGGAAVIFLVCMCACHDPLRVPPGFPRERAAEMKMCTLKVYRDIPSASGPVGEWRKQNWAEGKLRYAMGRQSMGLLRSWKHGVRSLYLCGQSLSTDDSREARESWAVDPSWRGTQLRATSG